MNEIRKWMRLVERTTLGEAVVYSEPTDDGHRFTVVRDPTAEQFNAMLKKSRHGLLRMLCRDRQIYCWDGYYADHDITAHYILGFDGGPATIGVRLEATREFVNYGERISVDLHGTKYGPRDYSVIRDLAKSNAKGDLSDLLSEYPRLRELVGSLPVSIDCKATFDNNEMEFYRDMMIGTLDSF
jgi:hypothetical protein